MRDILYETDYSLSHHELYHPASHTCQQTTLTYYSSPHGFIARRKFKPPCMPISRERQSWASIQADALQAPVHRPTQSPPTVIYIVCYISVLNVRPTLTDVPSIESSFGKFEKARNTVSIDSSSIVPNAQNSWRLAKFQKFWKMLCDTTAELHCHDLGPDHQPPHTAHPDGPAVHHTAGTQSAV